MVKKKNIHILPTDKPSRLYKSKITQDVFISDNRSQHGDATYNVNIYITSDEEIKEGDWIIENNNLGKCTNELWVKRGASILTKKIILTTDQDLINDGVQKIDDEFLQWFIKNPRCEWVEIRKEMYMPQSNGKISDGKITHEISLDPSQNILSYYKIIIPKEEPKQFTNEMLIDLKQGLDNAIQKSNPLFPNFNYLNKMKNKETLEEAAEDFLNTFNGSPSEVKLFIAGAKWQQDRMYSEAIEFAEWIRIKDFQTASKDNWIGLNMEYYTTQDLFEQFKKK